jgi:hypothetical protein
VIENEWLLGLSGLASVILGAILAAGRRAADRLGVGYPQWREAITPCRSNSTSRIDPFTRRWRGARRASRVVAGEPNRARR